VKPSANHRPLKRVLIYGAGEAGLRLVNEFASNRRLRYKACGFIDDDPGKFGQTIAGTPVLGSGADLGRLLEHHQIEEILIAMPSATGWEMSAVFNRCREAGVHSRLIPSLSELIEGRGMAGQMRDVDVEDLLGRRPVRLDEHKIRAKLSGQTILVTGAGGSIGSGLCRQIARFHPGAIIAFDISENSIFHLDQEMRERAPGIKFVPEIGNIQNGRRVRDVLRKHRPSIIYHAAAHKHVPLMEDHVFQAVENNVIGTCTLIEAAARSHVQDFVLISTDKAVHPASVMGVTKRMAELMVHSLPDAPKRTASVRFGNVLGSNGSVIPLFKKQIAAGGPVTVTHPDMQRYFMTIPEAVLLVLQASAMSHGGEVFVLDMGKPVKIVELANNLIQLSGLQPEEDIRIEFTGVRPGEKLFEELNTEDERLLNTSHEKIRIFTGPNLKVSDPDWHVGRLRQLCRGRNLPGLLEEIQVLVPEYLPGERVRAQLAEFQRLESVAAG
jgi:FlaA1/EpsC-like NDP-sugar epimerase